MQKEIEVSGRTFKIKSLTIDEGLNFKPNEDTKQTTYEFVVKCLVEPKMTIDEFKVLDFPEGLAIINAVNELNGLTDFQKPKASS